MHRPSLTPEEISLVAKKLGDLNHELMEKLNNQIVSFVSQSKLPLPNALMVLKLVESELVAQARKKYLGE